MEEAHNSGSLPPMCKFCPNAGAPSAGRYTCPRCNARYCSADCYKSGAHSACSESFYRDCFMEGLRDMGSDMTQRERVAEMLRRLESEDLGATPDPEAEEEEDLSERLAGVDLDRAMPDEIWQRLTDAERREFDDFINSGRLTDIIPLWTPWWALASSKSLIEEVATAPLTEEVNRKPKPKPVPAALSEIPDLAKLVGKSGVSELVPFSIVNLLYGYAYAARLYNGDHVAMVPEAVHVVLDISESLGHEAYRDAATAVGACLARLENDDATRSHFVSREYSVAVVGDVIAIISGPATSRPADYVIAALSDCHRMFKKARQDVRKGGSVPEDAGRTRVHFAGQKKLEFLLAWTASSERRVLQTLLPALELESCELMTQLAVHQSDKDCVERALELNKLASSKLQLITEISAD